MEENNCLMCYGFDDKMICDQCYKIYRKLYKKERIKYINDNSSNKISELCDMCLNKYEYPVHLETFNNFIRYHIHKEYDQQ